MFIEISQISLDSQTGSILEKRRGSFAVINILVPEICNTILNKNVKKEKRQEYNVHWLSYVLKLVLQPQKEKSKKTIQYKTDIL